MVVHINNRIAVSKDIGLTRDHMDQESACLGLGGLRADQQQHSQGG